MSRVASESLVVVAVAAALLAVAEPAGGATTVSGRTAGGAYYQIVVPDPWNGDLLIWNHGFSLAQPGPVEGLEDDFVVQLLEGYAVAASSYRLAGWAVFKTNQDLRALVRAFEDRFGPPGRIILAGVSLGGIVTAAAIEKADLGNVVGALTLCGAVAGSRNWDAALDLRLLYDVTCAGVEGASIPGGASGLPRDSAWTAADVERAVDACTGVDRARARRTPLQQDRLERLIALARVPESFIQKGMWYATFGLRDLVHDRRKLKGRSGVGNETVAYGDAEVDRTIERVRPRRSSARRLERFFTPRGRVGDVKIVSLHTSGDGLVFVENLESYASVVPRKNLSTAIAVEQQPSHCLFEPAEVLAGWSALRAWIDGGAQPTAADIQSECGGWRAILGGRCRFDPEYEVPPFDGRVRPRAGR